VAVVAAGAISVVALFGVGQLADVPVQESSLFWDIVLLVVSLLLIAYGVRFGVRGPTYVGAVGLFFFALIVGFDLEDRAAPDGSLLGWPLALVLLGLAAIIASLIPGLRTGSLGLDRLESDEPPPPQPPAETGPAPGAGGPLLR
jgi:NADH:ubiquinone oxidoreductase subunit 6 (subunit J)